MKRRKGNEYLTVSEVAADWGMSYGTVRRLIRSEGLPAYRFGKSLRLSKAEVADWNKKRRVAI